MTTEIIDNTQTPEVAEAVENTTPELTTDELASRVKELEGFNSRLLQENKSLKSEKKEPVEVDEKPKPKAGAKEESMSLRDIAVISELTKEYSIEELEEAKKYIGTPLGSTLKEVAQSHGFKAEISRARENNKSEEMIDEISLDMKPIETKKSIIRDIESGAIDYKAPGNEHYRKLYVEHLASIPE